MDDTFSLLSNKGLISVGADSIATSNASFDGILCGGCTNTSGCFVSGVVLLLFVPVLLLLIIALPLILTFVFGVIIFVHGISKLIDVDVPCGFSRRQPIVYGGDGVK